METKKLDKKVLVVEDDTFILDTIVRKFNSLISNPNQFGTITQTYKGFKFAIREENNPKLTVRGNKRHYAVAIDTNNVEVLKSESSFTLDPEDLINTLILIIDKEKLIA
jgi:translation initiation factor RLI1